ncbi:MAG: family 20 glycosylhydrolase [Armatimonadota bacterium]
MRSLLHALVLFATCAAVHAAGLGTDFGSQTLPPYLTPIGDFRVGEGVLQSASQPGWNRSGIEIGPLPVPEGAWTIEYDFRPLKLGSQTSEFASTSPSTHWYMCYVSANGRLNLHTKGPDGWKARTSSTAVAEVGKWYRAAVTLTCRSIRFVFRERGQAEPLWDSGEVAMDDTGKETTCALVDEAVDDKSASEWDNVKLSASDPSLEAGLQKVAAQIEAQRRRKQKMAETCAALKARNIALIPIPQQVELWPGSLSLSSLTIATERVAGDTEVVKRVLQERLPKLPVEAAVGGNLKVIRWTHKMAPPWQTDQGYQLRVLPKSIELEAETEAGFFYGAQTLCQLLQAGKLPQGIITDWPQIPNRLVMIAVSQGGFQVIDTEYWKRLIRELSALKINYIMPYDEGGTFIYQKYPFLGIKGEGGFTHEKSRLLSEYAKQHFVQLVPQQQMLGHSSSALSHEELKNLREAGNADVFCVSNPRTYEYLGDLMDELAKMFPHAKYLHVGGDEFAHNFAKCPQCKARADEIGQPALYAEHMMKLHGMLKQRGRQMMIWWHEQGYTDQAAEKLAKDIVVFDWHYGNQSSYPTLQRLQEEGFKQTWATPAVTRYYGAGNDWDNTFGNISGFMLAAAERKVPGECTCTWVQGIWGGRNIFELNLYGLAFSGQCSWNPLASDYGDFRWRFARQWFGIPVSVSPDTLEQEMLSGIHMPYGTRKEQKFWSNNRIAEEQFIAPPTSKIVETLVKQPELVEQAKELQVFCARAKENLEKLHQQATRNQVSLKFFAHDVLVMATTAKRIVLTKQLVDAYAEAKALPADQARVKLQPVIDEMKSLIGDYKTLEQDFSASILEAGGGRCGTGGWVPYISGGGIIFRAPQGRAELEKEVANLEKVLAEGKLPDQLFGK